MDKQNAKTFMNSRQLKVEIRIFFITILRNFMIDFLSVAHTIITGSIEADPHNAMNHTL